MFRSFAEFVAMHFALTQRNDTQYWKDVQESIIELHKRHTINYSTVLRLVPIEREDDVLVELSLFSRVSGIGTVPSRWRILVKQVEDDEWKIYSIDAIEIAGRSFR